MSCSRVARLVVIAIGTVGGRAVAEPCAASAHVTGDRDAVERVDAELRKLGDLVDAVSAGCPAPIEAAVQLDGAGLAVAVSDAAHRSEGRVVDDPVVAAEWIDSWMHDSLDPWRALAPPSSVAPDPRREDEERARASDALQARLDNLRTYARPSLLDRLSVSAGYEASLMTDGPAWQGFYAAACLRVGFACVGLRGRYDEQTGVWGQTEAYRQDAVVLATASTTLRAGAMRIAPELGVGVGAFTTSRVDGCPLAPDPANEPPPVQPAGCNDMVLVVGDHFTNTTVAPRAALAVRLALPLVGPLWLDGFASAGASPFAHTSPFTTAPQDVPPNVPPSAVNLPGEPVFAFQLGVGLRVEATK